jgi:hypothetical protein
MKSETAGQRLNSLILDNKGALAITSILLIRHWLDHAAKKKKRIRNKQPLPVMP